MFTIEEICEEQERQYNQLMEEDDQYCHPESFKWGFEHGVEYALSKLGWHPASELPPLGKRVIVWYKTADGMYHAIDNLYTSNGWAFYGMNIIAWCYPQEEK